MTPLNPGRDISNERDNMSSHTEDCMESLNSRARTISPGNIELSQVQPPCTTYQNGPVEPAFQVLAKESRKLIQTIQQLGALNIDTTLPSLPKFIVVGDQSAGKSSLIEAACAISLPRDEGTCTRCPYSITTTAHGATTDGDCEQLWKCDVSLHIGWYPIGINNQIRSTLDKDGETFHGWSKQAMKKIPFAEVTVKEDLEGVLRRAQLAILNPYEDSAFFKTISEAQRRQRELSNALSFSPNFVSLEIRGQNLPELSLTDLPGLISMTPDFRDRHLVGFVEELLSSYIKDENTLILLICDGSQDVDTAAVLRLLDRYRAFDRCLGVLTKLDLIQVTNQRLAKLRTILQGNEFKVGRGWYLTKQLSQLELDQKLPYDHARALEAAFFANQPWADLATTFNDRCGTSNLQKALSRELTEHIKTSLPEINTRLRDKISEVSDDLETFPQRSNSAVTDVGIRIANLNVTIDDQLNPDSVRCEFRAQYYAEVFRHFSEELDRIAPQVICTTPGYTKLSISVDDDDCHEDAFVTPSKKSKGNSGRAIKSTPPRASEVVSTPASKRRRPVATQSSEGSEKYFFRLDETKARYDSAPSADMPGALCTFVNRELKLKPLGSWLGLVDKAMNDVERLMLAMLKKAVIMSMGPYAKTQLGLQSFEISKNLLEEFMEKQRKDAANLVASHLHRPMTFATESWQAKLSRARGRLLKKRNRQRVDEYWDVKEVRGEKVPSKPEQEKKWTEPKSTWIHDTLGEDEYEREVKALAEPLAYYELASEQLVDVLARQTEFGLIYKYKESLLKVLQKGLHAHNANHCAMLLADDPAREQRRAALEEELERLQQALAELKGLYESST